MIRLNCGSGQRRFEGHGWVNIDCVSRPGQVPDVLCDIARGRWPYEDGTVDLVVLHHVYEHLHLNEGDDVLRESQRVLRRGGSLIITVPDVRELAKAWLQGKIDDYIFMVNIYGAWQGEPGDSHAWGWYGKTLAEHLMNTCAWSAVKSFDWREIPGASIAKDWYILGVEAIR